MLTLKGLNPDKLALYQDIQEAIWRGDNDWLQNLLNNLREDKDNLINRVDDEGNTLLYQAISSAHCYFPKTIRPPEQTAVERLLGVNGIRINRRDSQGGTLFHHVVDCWNQQVEGSDWGTNPIAHQIDNIYQIIIMQLSIEWPSGIYQVNAAQQNPLHRAVAFGNLAAIAMLLKVGVDFNACDTGGQSPLSLALAPEGVLAQLNKMNGGKAEWSSCHQAVHCLGGAIKKKTSKLSNGDKLNLKYQIDFHQAVIHALLLNGASMDVPDEDVQMLLAWAKGTEGHNLTWLIQTLQDQKIQAVQEAQEALESQGVQDFQGGQGAAEDSKERQMESSLGILKILGYLVLSPLAVFVTLIFWGLKKANKNENVELSSSSDRVDEDLDQVSQKASEQKTFGHLYKVVCSWVVPSLGPESHCDIVQREEVKKLTHQ